MLAAAAAEADAEAAPGAAGAGAYAKCKWAVCKPEPKIPTPFATKAAVEEAVINAVLGHTGA